MDAERFDALARALATTASRRETIGVLAVGALGGIRGWLSGIVGEARRGSTDPGDLPPDDRPGQCAGCGTCQTCELHSAGGLVCGGHCDEPCAAGQLCHLARQDAAYRQLERALRERGYAAAPAPESFILRQGGKDRVATFVSPYRPPHGGAKVAHLFHARHASHAASLALIPLDDDPGLEVLVGDGMGVERLLPSDPRAWERLAEPPLALAQTSPGICSTLDLLCDYVGDFAACVAVGIRSCGPNLICEALVNAVCNLLGILGCFLTRAAVGCCSEECRACEVCDPSPQNLTPFCRSCDPDRCETCQDGICVGCPDGQQCCDGRCVDVHDPDHCFACNRACPSGQVCCPSGLFEGPGGCRDLSSDRDYCGSCNNRCTGGRFLCCGGQCVNVFENPDHCGACDDACPQGQVCTNRQCRRCRYTDDRFNLEMSHACSPCEACNEETGWCEDTCGPCERCDRTAGECRSVCEDGTTCDPVTGECGEPPCDNGGVPCRGYPYGCCDPGDTCCPDQGFCCSDGCLCCLGLCCCDGLQCSDEIGHCQEV